MSNYILVDFLKDNQQYEAAVKYWRDLWLKTDKLHRDLNDWQEPWMPPSLTDLRDGNPIFTAYSPLLRKGIRIIQYPPDDDIDFQYWLDTFGGEIGDPDVIEELVIACALSTETSAQALALMDNWLCSSKIGLASPEPFG